MCSTRSYRRIIFTYQVLVGILGTCSTHLVYEKKKKKKVVSQNRQICTSRFLFVPYLVGPIYYGPLYILVREQSVGGSKPCCKAIMYTWYLVVFISRPRISYFPEISGRVSCGTLSFPVFSIVERATPFVGVS